MHELSERARGKPLVDGQCELAVALTCSGTDDDPADDPSAAIHDQLGEAVGLTLGHGAIDVLVESRTSSEGRQRSGPG